MSLALHSRHAFTACSRDLSCCISSPPGQLIGLLSVLLRNHAAMLQAFTTYSNTATLVKYYCPKLTTTANGAQLGGWVQKEEFETECASVRPAAAAAAIALGARTSARMLSTQASSNRRSSQLDQPPRAVYNSACGLPRVIYHTLLSSYTVRILCSAPRRLEPVF